MPDLQQALALIRHRRTIKPAAMDPSRPVGEELMGQLLQAARWAPTHGMTEPWRFVVFQGEARTRLAAKLQELYRQHTPTESFRPDKFKKLKQNPLLAPAVMTIGMARAPGEKIPEIEEVEAVACAVQNMHLCASAAGLAAFWSSPPVCYLPEMADWLDLGKGGKCLGLFYLGWPAEGATWPQGQRQEITPRVRFESRGKT